jgi:hypothetical protein
MLSAEQLDLLAETIHVLLGPLTRLTTSPGPTRPLPPGCP